MKKATKKKTKRFTRADVVRAARTMTRGGLRDVDAGAYTVSAQTQKRTHKMDAVTTLNAGGMAVVVLGRDIDAVPKPFGAHPQLCVLAGADLPMAMPEIADKFPDNTKLVIVGGMLAHSTFGFVQKAAERRQVPWIHRRNGTALGDTLAALLKRENGPTEQGDSTGSRPVDAPKRGGLKALIEELADLSKGSAEEARRILPIIQQRGVSTTFGSLAQGIAVAKRKAGATGVPRSIMSPQARILSTIDDAIAGLQLAREDVIRVEQENAELRTKLGKATKALAALSEVMQES